MEYIKSELLATIKHTNLTNDSLRLYYHNSITFENYEIKNLKNEFLDSLISFYDYSFYPNWDDSDYVFVSPKEYYETETYLSFNLDLFFFERNTYLIRVKKEYEGVLTYSNWDTLIVR